jgi:hypothetical protein
MSTGRADAVRTVGDLAGWSNEASRAASGYAAGLW